MKRFETMIKYEVWNSPKSQALLSQASCSPENLFGPRFLQVPLISTSHSAKKMFSGPSPEHSGKGVFVIKLPKNTISSNKIGINYQVHPTKHSKGILPWVLFRSKPQIHNSLVTSIFVKNAECLKGCLLTWKYLQKWKYFSSDIECSGKKERVHYIEIYMKIWKYMKTLPCWGGRVWHRYPVQQKYRHWRRLWEKGSVNVCFFWGIL